MSGIVPGSLEDQNVVLDLSAFVASTGDPFRPHETIVPPGVATVPPACPRDFVLLHYVDQNDKGDLLFECLQDGCGYYAVYRLAEREWEQCTSRDDSKRWAPPLTLREAQRRAADRQPVMAR